MLLKDGWRARAEAVVSSVAVSREHRSAKTDRLDAELLKRVFLGWLRGESDRCSMAGIPTLGEEHARRPQPREGKPVGRAHAHRKSGGTRTCATRLHVPISQVVIASAQNEPKEDFKDSAPL
jgi:hypothetical protein